MVSAVLSYNHLEFIVIELSDSQFEILERLCKEQSDGFFAKITLEQKHYLDSEIELLQKAGLTISKMDFQKYISGKEIEKIQIRHLFYV